MPPKIPGFFFDPEKNRYFKVTAPSPNNNASSAQYTPSAIKRRQNEAQTAKKVRRRKYQIQRNIKRSPLDDFWTFSGPLDQEIYGGRGVGGTGGRVKGPKGRVDEGDVRTMAWAKEIVGKSCVRFAEDRGDGVNLGAFWVEEDVENGKGVIWATADDRHVQSAVFETTSDGKLRTLHPFFDIDTRRIPTILENGGHIGDHITSIVYDDFVQPEVLVTSLDPMRVPGFHILSMGGPQVAVNDRIGVVPGQNRERGWRPHDSLRGLQWCTNTLARPKSHEFRHDIRCFFGTNQGILAVPHEHEMPENKIVTEESTRLDFEVFAIDFQPSPGMKLGRLAFAGGRSPKIWSIDSRGSWKGETYRSTFAPDDGETTGTITHGSPVSNLKFVNEHQLLAAGPRSKMSLYDIRFTKKSPLKGMYDSTPITTFPAYKNEAHFDLGFDVSPDGCTVVAAQDDGNVKVFSTSSGWEIMCPQFDNMKDRLRRGVVRALQFGKERGDLYIGMGGRVGKFGFGTNNMDLF